VANPYIFAEPESWNWPLAAGQDQSELLDPADPNAGRFVRYHFTPEFLKLKNVGATVEFRFWGQGWTLGPVYLALRGEVWFEGRRWPLGVKIYVLSLHFSI
jgi:hypothetical protein